MWADAKKQVEKEKEAWPYSWVINQPQYPSAAERGSLKGQFAISDPAKPGVKGAFAWVGLTNPGILNWERDSKNYQYWAKADEKGDFVIEDIRSGMYDLHAFVNGATGEYTMQNITIEAGKIKNIGTLTRHIPRTNGKLVWEIGVPNRTAREFRFGDEYFNAFMWEKYSAELPGIIEYDADKGNWKDNLNSAHSSYYVAKVDSFVAWPWNINFKLKSLPDTGTAVLNFAFASLHGASLLVTVNENTPHTFSKTENYGGPNTLVRQGIHGKYSMHMRIPVSELKKGSNTITLLMGRYGGRVNHIMYDYISLEVPDE
jgi:hypothetical protein